MWHGNVCVHGGCGTGGCGTEMGKGTSGTLQVLGCEGRQTCHHHCSASNCCCKGVKRGSDVRVLDHMKTIVWHESSPDALSELGLDMIA